MKRAFEVKQKTFFIASQVLSFRLTKQTSKNLVDTIFTDQCSPSYRNQSIDLFCKSIDCFQCDGGTIVVNMLRYIAFKVLFSGFIVKVLISGYYS